MKRDKAKLMLEDFLIECVENQNIHVVEINGMKKVGFCLDIEDKLLDFIENELKMLPPLNESNYHNMNNDDRVHENITVNFYHKWEV